MSVSGVAIEPPLLGNWVKVVVEEMKAGNYTCHLSPSGEYLNHTEVLIQLDSTNDRVILNRIANEEGEIRKMEGGRGGMTVLRGRK